MAEVLSMKKLQKEVDELRREFEEFKESFTAKSANIVFGKLNVGDKFELIGIKWKILDITDKGYMCLAERIESKEFDKKSNDWKVSDLRKYLNSDFFEKLSRAIGEKNIVSFERDLLSLDGQTEYGVCEDKVSLLTVDEYRKYRKHIPNEDYWWWTITPDSTACNDDNIWVRVVSPSGRFDYGGCVYGHGVRPFCIFSSSLFESEDN